MIIFLIFLLSKIEEPAPWLYAIAIELLVIDSVVIRFIYSVIAN